MKHLSKRNFYSVTNTTKLKVSTLEKFNMFMLWYGFTFIRSHCQRFVNKMLARKWFSSVLFASYLMHIYVVYVCVVCVCTYTCVSLSHSVCACVCVLVCVYKSQVDIKHFLQLRSNFFSETGSLAEHEAHYFS